MWFFAISAAFLFLVGILFSFRSSQCVLEILELSGARAKMSYRAAEAVERIRGLHGDKQVQARRRWQDYRRYANYAALCRGLAVLAAFIAAAIVLYLKFASI